MKLCFTKDLSAFLFKDFPLGNMNYQEKVKLDLSNTNLLNLESALSIRDKCLKDESEIF
jgi:hypothetical protein